MGGGGWNPLHTSWIFQTPSHLELKIASKTTSLSLDFTTQAAEYLVNVSIRCKIQTPLA